MKTEGDLGLALFFPLLVEPVWPWAMSKFRDIKTLEKFAAIQASTFSHFNLDRKLTRRDEFKQKRSAALAEWCQLAA